MRTTGPRECRMCERPTWNPDAVCIRTVCRLADGAGLDLEAGLSVRVLADARDTVGQPDEFDVACS